MPARSQAPGRRRLALRNQAGRLSGHRPGGREVCADVFHLRPGFHFSIPAHCICAKPSQPGKLVLAGEIVALDENGRASFQELQNRRTSRQPIVYYVFDILHHNGRDLLGIPLTGRKRRLERIGEHFEGPLRLNPLFRTRLNPLVAQVRSLALEGIVAKRASSIYLPGRVSDAWQKRRFNQESEFVIGGYVASGNNFSSIVVGEYRGTDLYYVKRVAAGFTPYLRQHVFKELQPLVTPNCPFVNLPELTRSGHGLSAEKMKECEWVKPERRCELEFVERTASGRLRHAVFRRLLR